MPSPFPGMNRYLEQAAEDFHTEFLTTIRRTLTPQVGPNYFVQLEEQIYIHDMPPAPRTPLGRADCRSPVHVPRMEPASRWVFWKLWRRSISASRTKSGSDCWRSGIAEAGSLLPSSNS